MTGVADLYQLLRKPHSRDAWARVKSTLTANNHEHTRFVVLSWKRTGSNLLCGILYNHPEITMHNELFNTIDIFTYHPKALDVTSEEKRRWTVLGRDLHPESFLEHIWTGRYSNGDRIRSNCKAVGFKSFPEHWRDSHNEDVFLKAIIEDPNVKKVILYRESELAVFVSMARAELTGSYMTHKYPKTLKVHVDPAKFQAFVNNYRHTFQRRYKSSTADGDTFRLTYEQLTHNEHFEGTVLPLLWCFLGVDKHLTAKRLADTVKQSAERESLANVISNYAHLEFCFRHTDVRLPFRFHPEGTSKRIHIQESSYGCNAPGSWSILLPICSRKIICADFCESFTTQTVNINRFAEIERRSSYSPGNCLSQQSCWERLERFIHAFIETTSEETRARTEFIVGIDIDDAVFSSKDAQDRLKALLPAEVVFVFIKPVMYGKICRIWSLLGSNAKHDFLVLLGDDVQLMDVEWQSKVENEFHRMAERTGLPFGAACIAMNDLSFPGFPTFPVIHRWHVKHFGRLLPRQFVNQGGDPFLYELYSRWNASTFVMSARLKNTVGGDSDARYHKHSINWKGQVLRTNALKLQENLGGGTPTGICLDVVVPSYRVDNIPLLERIISLRGSTHLNVRFWLVVDNTDGPNLQKIRSLARRANMDQSDGNYTVFVVSYGENRGASYARNTGFNYSTADWVLFLDDDVVPDRYILDAYAGAIFRYPNAKVMVGLTEMPVPCNLWTEMLTASKVMYFYGVSNHRTHPPWGVTANLLVSGSRHHHTVQFKDIYPKTGGGEDIDFIFQLKEKYGSCGSVVAVPGAKVQHPWWRSAKVCYSQICGWAWGDSLCMTEWPEKTFRTLPNWIEFIFLLVLVTVVDSRHPTSFFRSALLVAFIDHLMKSFQFYQRNRGGTFYSAVVAIGASTVISAQECSRMWALLRRRAPGSFARRMDWFDGQAQTQVLDYQLRSAIAFALFSLVGWLCL